MTFPHPAGRYGIFGAGLVFTTLGISLITKAGLGSSPVSSLAYVLTFVTPLSLGTAAFLTNLAMLLAQVCILRRRFAPSQWLQLPATLVFSLFLDGWMLLWSAWNPEWYAARIAVLLTGCAALGLGVALQVLADVLILPAEGLVKVIAQETAREFGLVKTLYDIALVTLAAVVSAGCIGSVAGIREGTLVCALTVGFISRFFRIRLAPVLHKSPCAAPAALS